MPGSLLTSQKRLDKPQRSDVQIDLNMRRYIVAMGGEFETSPPVATKARPRTLPSRRGPRRFVSIREVMARTSLSRKELNRLIALGKLRDPLKMNFHAFVWDSAYIHEWIDDRLSLR